MRKIPIENFCIPSDYRKETTDVGSLALSIQEVGLLYPILVEQQDDKFIITEGRRRFRALTEVLGYTELEEFEHFMERKNLKVANDLVIQFIGNNEREDFKPLEAASLVRDIHASYVSVYGVAVPGGKSKRKGWRLEDTGRIIGKDKAYVSRMLSFLEFPEEIKECKTVSEAMHTVESIKRKKLLETVRSERVKKVISSMSLRMDDLLKGFKLMEAVPFLESLDDECCSLVFTDPPFGMEYDDIGGGENYDTYEDDPKEVMSLIAECIPHYYRILKPNKFCIIWTSFDFAKPVKDLMSKAGFFISNTPLFWVKTNSSGRSNDPDHKPGSIVEQAVFGWKGSGAELSIKGQANVFPYPTVKGKDRIHIAQKPDSLGVRFLEMFSLPGDVVCDTFAGSAYALRACYLTKRAFIGCEKSKANYDRAVTYCRDWLKTLEDEQIANDN